MPLIQFLYKVNKTLLISSVFVGLLGGGLSSAMIAIIHIQLKSDLGNWMYLTYFFLFMVGNVVFSILTDVLLIRLTQLALYQLRLSLSRQILSQPLRTIEKYGSHRFLVVLTEDLTTINDTLVQFPGILVQIAIIFGCYSYMLWLSWEMALIGSVIGILMFGGMRFLVEIAKSNLGKAREQWNRLFQHFNELTQGTKELLLNHPKKQTFLNEHLERCCELLMKENISGRSLLQICARVSDLSAYLGLGFVIFVLPNLMTVDKEVLMGYALAALFLLYPFNKVVTFFSQIARSNVSLRHIEAMGLTVVPNSTGPEGNAPIPFPQSSSNTLTLNNLRYHYEGNESESFHLGPISCSAASGQITFVTGGNGSGKSTFAKLLCGLYSLDEGQIQWNGEDITEANRDAFQQNFSAIFSDYFLFEHLFDNGKPELEATVSGYLKDFYLDKKVQMVDGKFSTIDLSQGQRKRLALLNAYLEDRPVYIFDEWASDQDPAFKHIFYHQILQDLKKRGKIVFVISHDDAYFHLADQTLKLDYGHIVEPPN